MKKNYKDCVYIYDEKKKKMINVSCVEQYSNVFVARVCRSSTKKRTLIY